MPSNALQMFEHAIRDATDLLDHFDALNTNPPPPQIEVLKRASLVMALAALETYFEDRLVEATEVVCAKNGDGQILRTFYRESLAADLKVFHKPSTDRVRNIFQKYLGIDVSEGWSWNNVDPAAARVELNRLAKKARRYRAPVLAPSQRAAAITQARGHTRGPSEAHSFRTPFGIRDGRPSGD